MSDKYFLDTDILVYAFDKEDIQKQRIAKHYLDCLLNNPNYVISLQVVNEFCHVVLKKLAPVMPQDRLRAFVNYIPESRIVPLTKKITLKTLEVKDRYLFAFWDSMIVATAMVNQCDYLLTEDLSHSQKVDQVTIINPFREE
jgi:predicted nucleic acid-binding protein